MTYCELCGWVRNPEHNEDVRWVVHLRQDHGLSRRKVALRLAVRERFVRDHAEHEPKP